MEIKNVTIAGGGTLGSQVSWQTAFKGFNVMVYDGYDKGIEICKAFHLKYADIYKAVFNASDEVIEQAFNRIAYTTNLAEAVQDSDLISESIPENLEIKKSFYRELAKMAPSKTIFATNASTLLPSEYAAESGRPEKFLAMHFANRLWKSNVAEIMGHTGTDPEVFNQVILFAKAIGMVPIPIYKEQRGYVLNSLLIPLLAAATGLVMNGVADAETIDKTWMVCTGVQVGPLGILDLVGLETMHDVCAYQGYKLGDKRMAAIAEFVKTNYIDKNILGIKTGKGFYDYPNPAYAASEFLN
jgi:3-hydroxyacyl-CoA dehydrogenase